MLRRSQAETLVPRGPLSALHLQQDQPAWKKPSAPSPQALLVQELRQAVRRPDGDDLHGAAPVVVGLVGLPVPDGSEPVEPADCPGVEPG